MNPELGLQLRAERTPNPDSVKWVVSPPFPGVGAVANFDAAPGVEVSPLAQALFAIPGVVNVLLAPNFVTVTKSPDAAWPALAQPLVDAIRSFVAGGAPALAPGFSARDGPGAESPLELRIRAILDHDIRPFVARDGGDVLFAGFRDGIVELILRGACSGCPSSTATLQLGIERRLKEALPEVREVVAL